MYVTDKAVVNLSFHMRLNCHCYRQLFKVNWKRFAHDATIAPLTQLLLPTNFTCQLRCHAWWFKSNQFLNCALSIAKHCPRVNVVYKLNTILVGIKVQNFFYCCYSYNFTLPNEHVYVTRFYTFLTSYWLSSCRVPVIVQKNKFPKSN